MKIDLDWQCLRFDELTTHQLYQLLKLRTEIFVVEQHCAYLETDGKDCHPNVHHLLGYHQNEIIAVSRLLPAKVSYTTPSLGRVVVATKARKQQLGHRLLRQSILQCERLWPNQPITIGAQYHLRTFYQQHGFEIISAPYDEDGILHVDMRRLAQ